MTSLPAATASLNPGDHFETVANISQQKEDKDVGISYVGGVWHLRRGFKDGIGEDIVAIASGTIRSTTQLHSTTPSTISAMEILQSFRTVSCDEDCQCQLLDRGQ